MINLSNLSEEYADQPHERLLRHIFDIPWNGERPPAPQFKEIRFKADAHY